MTRTRNGKLGLRILDDNPVDVDAWLTAARGLGTTELARRLGVTLRQAQRILAGGASRETFTGLAVRMPIPGGPA